MGNGGKVHLLCATSVPGGSSGQAGNAGKAGKPGILGTDGSVGIAGISGIGSGGNVHLLGGVGIATTSHRLILQAQNALKERRPRGPDRRP
jgi:hypothetical protein